MPTQSTQISSEKCKMVELSGQVRKTMKRCLHYQSKLRKKKKKFEMGKLSGQVHEGQLSDRINT